MRILLIILLVLSTLGLSGAGFLLLKNRKATPTVKVEPKSYVIVPQKDLVRGHVISPGDLTWVEWPSSSATKFVTSKDKENSKLSKFTGRVVRSEISANAPILEKNFISKDVAGGLVSALLEPGKRAFTLSVGVDTGGGGFIFPGDFVDIILIQNLRDKLPRSKSGAAPVRLTDQILNSAAEIILENIKVLAVGTQTYVARTSSDKPVTPVKTITLEVDQQESQKLAIAKTLGSFSVVLRSLVSGSEGKNTEYLADTKVSKALKTVIEEAEKNRGISNPSSNNKNTPEQVKRETNISKSIKIFSGRSVTEKKIAP